MDPSDTFETFDMTTLDDFLARDSFEDEGSALNLGQSAGSSFSDSFDQLPVYRSLDVMADDDFAQLQSLSGIDKVYEAPVSVSVPMPMPVLSRQKTAPTSSGGAMEDDLFAQLDADLAHLSVPCQSDLLGGMASVTSVVVVASDLEELSASVFSFLESRGVEHVHCASSGLWRCELTDFVDSCKFHVQVYCDEDDVLEGCVEYTVEFLRISGCSLLFSAQFQSFKASQQQQGKREVHVELSDVSSLAQLDLFSSQDALESLVGWVSADQATAVSAVAGLFSTSGTSSIPLSLTSDGQLSAEGITVMTLLGTLCMHFKDAEVESTSASPSSSSLPMLSLLCLLLQLRGQNDLHPTTHTVLSTLVDSLVPATVRLTVNSHVSACERAMAVQMMEQLI
jgi:hypothetical protein